jgi:hypothetical protein
VVVGPLYRLSVYSVDGLSSRELSVGRSALEVMTGASSQSVTLPASHGVEPYKVLLTESFSTMQSDASNKELFQSVPVSVYVDKPVCSTLSANACLLSMNLLNFEFGEHVEDESKFYFTSCTRDELTVETYSCPSGTNVTAHCNGTIGDIIVSNCPVHIPTSSCDALSNMGTGFECTVLEYTENMTVCECEAPSPDLHDSWKVQYVSVASSELTNSSTVYTSSNRNGNDVIENFAYSWVLYAVTIYVAGFFLVSVFKSLKHDIEPRDSVALTSSPQELLDDGLPHIFKTKEFLDRMFDELRQHHRWTCICSQSFDDDSDKLRRFSVFSSTCFVFFLNSLIYHWFVIFYPKIDSAQICLITACISIFGAPVFVAIDAVCCQYLKPRCQVTMADDNDFYSEYREILYSIEDHASEMRYPRKFLGEFFAFVYLYSSHL